VAIDEETKLVPAFLVGKRTRHDTTAFLWDLYHRLAVPVQLTTDGSIHYTAMVPMCFGLDVDFALLIKMFDHGQFDSPEGRYSQAQSRRLYPECDAEILIPSISLQVSWKG